MESIKKRLYYLNPALWPICISLGGLWLITRLPYRCQIRIGEWIGKIMYQCSTKLKYITEVNINLCFPELTELERINLIKQNFRSLGIGLVETAMAWWLPNDKLKCSVKVTGAEHLDQAFAKGKGIILLSPHSTCLEMMGRLLGAQYSFAIMYRPHKKRLIAEVQERFRKKYSIRHITRQNIRSLIRTLDENMAVWYAYDVDGGEKRSVFAPFFGIPTASLTAVSRLVNRTDSTIIPISFHRLDSEWGYSITLHPPLENFPSGDLIQDATLLNAQLEQAIREKPEQYIWQYKRFKTRPPGEQRFY
jgi:KDO2-lipid IV(A) lauroyltransferase